MTWCFTIFCTYGDVDIDVDIDVNDDVDVDVDEGVSDFNGMIEEKN